MIVNFGKGYQIVLNEDCDQAGNVCEETVADRMAKFRVSE
jgi:hypothetical protein